MRAQFTQTLAAQLNTNDTLAWLGLDPFRFAEGGHLLIVGNNLFRSGTDFTLVVDARGIGTMTWINATPIANGATLRLGVAYIDSMSQSSGGAGGGGTSDTTAANQVIANNYLLAIKNANESVAPVEVYQRPKMSTVTLSVDTAVLAPGDIAAATEILAAVFQADDVGGILQSLVAVDESDQAAYDGEFVFLRTNVAMGAENSAPSISDTNAAQIMARHKFVAADWVDYGGVKVLFGDKLAKPVVPNAASDDMYVSMIVSSGAPDFVAATDVKLTVFVA